MVAWSEAWVCGRPAGAHGCLSLVSVAFCQVSLSDGLLTRPEQFYRVWYV